MAAALIAVNFLPSHPSDDPEPSLLMEITHPEARSTRQVLIREGDPSTEVAKESAQDSDPLNPEIVAAAREAAIEKMDEASTSYDPAKLPVIQPFLESEDPLLRDAAVDAMVVLGDASAGPMLRAAAKKLDSDLEAQKMREAAEYIELPPANLKEISEMLKKNKRENSKMSKP